MRYYESGDLYSYLGEAQLCWRDIVDISESYMVIFMEVENVADLTAVE